MSTYHLTSFLLFVVFIRSSILSLLISLLLALWQWWQTGSSVSGYGFYVCVLFGVEEYLLFIFFIINSLLGFGLSRS